MYNVTKARCPYGHRLDNFPFDRDFVRISLVPVEYLDHEVKFAVDNRTTGREPTFTIPGGSLQTPKAQIGTLPNPQTGISVRLLGDDALCVLVKSGFTVKGDADCGTE